MMTLDGTNEKVYKVTHELGFKSLTYPKGLVLKMKDHDSLDAELVPYDQGASPLLGGTVYLFNKDEKPKPWSGPEDGLPPVGSRVIVHECTNYHAKRFNGQLVRIVAHDEGKYAVFAADNFEYHALVAEKFKLPPTAADIAAELRETAIRELMDIAQVDCRVTAARLVDAGFKREVV